MSQPARVLSLSLFWLLTLPTCPGHAQDEIAAPHAPARARSRNCLGTISMFGPYGSGRFLSQFRAKIFSMPKGEAKVKAQLVAQGAHASIPVEAEGKSEKPQPEKKP